MERSDERELVAAEVAVMQEVARRLPAAQPNGNGSRNYNCFVKDNCR
jgi:hypothetical protein